MKPLILILILSFGLFTSCVAYVEKCPDYPPKKEKKK